MSSRSSRSTPLVVASFGALDLPETLGVGGALVAEWVKQAGSIRLRHALDRDKNGNARVMIVGSADVSLRDEEAGSRCIASDDDRLTEAVDVLLKRGAPVDAVDANGRTPLHWAVHGGAIRAVELLLAAKAPVNARTKSGHRRCSSPNRGIPPTAAHRAHSHAPA